MGAATQEPFPFQGTVKYYDPDKGFGFLAPNRDYQSLTGGKDVFFHIKDVKKAGFESVTEKQTIAGDAAPNDKGFGMVMIGFVGNKQETVEAVQELTPPKNATMKFFGNKGFGFATLDEDGTDVYVHITAVEQSKVNPTELTKERPIIVVVNPKDPKGPRVTHLELR